MTIQVGDPVEKISTSISTAGGTRTRVGSGLVGRVCKISDAGICCVQFKIIGCRRVSISKIRKSSEPAPQCTSKCKNGC